MADLPFPLLPRTVFIAVVSILLGDSLSATVEAPFQGLRALQHAGGELAPHIGGAAAGKATVSLEVTLPERAASSLDCNPTDADYPRGLTISELITRQATKTPLSCAVACAAQAISHRELDRASNRLARALVRRHGAPGTRIAVLLERSTDLVVTLLAILKAGAAHIPLDPAYPTERLSHEGSGFRSSA